MEGGVMTVNGLTVLIAVAVFLTWFLGARAALRRWDGSHDPQTPRRAHPRSRAWGTRARRSAHTVYRRAGTTLTWGRQAIALRIHGITIDSGATDAPAQTAGPAPSASEGGLKAGVAGGGVLVPSCAPARQPTRKATGAELRWHLTERDGTPLDYAPAPPFATVLSPDTLARGIPAVKP